MKIRSVAALFVLLCLVSGVLIYAVTRTESIYINQWLGYIDDGKVLHYFQSLTLNSQLPQWIIYSLPDAFWMFALIMTILTIWNFKVNIKSIPWIILSVAFGLLYEIFQGFHLIRGTFDIKDLLWSLVAAILPLSFIILKSRSCKRN